VVGRLPNKHEALNSNPVTFKLLSLAPSFKEKNFLLFISMKVFIHHNFLILTGKMDDDFGLKKN
jgi:hypothetical protein